MLWTTFSQEAASLFFFVRTVLRRRGAAEGIVPRLGKTSWQLRRLLHGPSGLSTNSVSYFSTSVPYPLPGSATAMA